MFLGQDLADLDADVVNASPGNDGVRTGQVDVLENAALGTGLGEVTGAKTGGIDGDHLAGLDLADEGAADDVNGSSFGGDHPSAGEAAQHERPDSLRVAGGTQGVVIHEDEAEGTLEVRQHLGGDLFEGAVVGRHESGDQRGVVAGVHPVLVRNIGVRRALDDEGLEGVGVGEVTVVGQGETATTLTRAEGRLGVVPDARTCRRVSGVPDGHVAPEGVEGGLVEDLGDQSHVLEDHHSATVRHRHASGFLASVLQGVHAEIGEFGHLLTRGIDPDDATGVLGPVVLGVEVCGKPSVCARHEATVSHTGRW